MATSGTYDFTLDIGEIIEEAYDLCSLELRGSYDLKTAKRSLDLLMREWANDQVNLWTVEEETLALTESVAEYTIDYPVLDILGLAFRSADGTDTLVGRISAEEYLSYTPKTTEASQPTAYTTFRTENGVVIKLWPVPDSVGATGSLVYYALKHVQDMGKFSNDPEVPDRFLPALTVGLAYKLSLKNKARIVNDKKTGQFIQVDGVDTNARQELKMLYEELYQKARYEDRERVDITLVPARRC